MVNRPRTIYLIAVWWWISYSIAAHRTVMHVVETVEREGDSLPAFLSAIALFLPLIAATFVIWELVALIQLRPKAILVLKWALGLWSLLILSRLHWLLSANPAGVVFAAILLALNAVVILYVSRPRFRDMCLAFREEKDLEMMLKRAKKDMKKFKG